MRQVKPLQQFKIEDILDFNKYDILKFLQTSVKINGTDFLLNTKSYRSHLLAQSFPLVEYINVNSSPELITPIRFLKYKLGFNKNGLLILKTYEIQNLYRKIDEIVTWDKQNGNLRKRLSKRYYEGIEKFKESLLESIFALHLWQQFSIIDKYVNVGNQTRRNVSKLGKINLLRTYRCYKKLINGYRYNLEFSNQVYLGKYYVYKY